MSNATTLPEFNPTNNEHVTFIKSHTEEILTYIKEKCPENRQSSIALTNYEQAAMWAVKSLFV